MGVYKFVKEIASSNLIIERGAVLYLDDINALKYLNTGHIVPLFDEYDDITEDDIVLSDIHTNPKHIRLPDTERAVAMRQREIKIEQQLKDEEARWLALSDEQRAAELERINYEGTP